MRGLFNFGERFGALKHKYQINKRRFVQNYLTVQDENGLLPLKKITKEVNYKDSRLSDPNCEFTPARQLIWQKQDLDQIDPKTEDPRKTASDFEWVWMEDKKFNKVFQKFMFSFKNIYTDNINASNLMFLTGPTKSGKSVLLRQNLLKFISN